MIKARIEIYDIKESNPHRGTGTDAEYIMNITVTGDDMRLMNLIRDKLSKLELKDE